MTTIRLRYLALAVLCLHAPCTAEEGKATVKKLIHDLQSAEPDQREHAAQALGQMGSDAAEATNALQKAMNDDFPYVRTRSGEALTRIGPSAIPVFIDALKNPNSDVRVIAASALGQYGAQADAAVPGLVKALGDVDAPVRQRATHSLEQIGPSAVDPLLHSLDHNKGPSALLALQALGGIRTDSDALVPRLLQALQDPDQQVRLAALKTLTRQGSGHVPQMVEGLQSANPEVRAQVADALADIGKPASKTVPALVELLSDASPAVRGSAARALGHMGSEATKTAIPALKKLRDDPDPMVATRAREALTNLIAAIEPTEAASENSSVSKVESSRVTSAPVAKAAVKHPPKPISKVSAKTPTKGKKALSVAQLMKELQSPDETLRAAAVSALIPLKVKAIPALTKALQDGTTAVRQNAAAAFIQVDSTAAIQAFTECAKGGELGSRLDALQALQTVGPQAESAVPILVDLLKDPDNDVQLAAEKTLTSIGTADAKKAVEVYTQDRRRKTIAILVKDLRQEGKTSNDAAGALVTLGAPTVKPVAAILGDPRPSGRLAAAKVLNQLGPVSAPASAELIRALDDSDAGVRQQAAETLGKINTPDAQKALRFFPYKEQYRKLLKMLHLG